MNMREIKMNMRERRIIERYNKERNKKVSETLNHFVDFFSSGVISTICGLGMFTFYVMMGGKPFLSFMVALGTTYCMTIIMMFYFKMKNKRDRKEKKK